MNSLEDLTCYTAETRTSCIEHIRLDSKGYISLQHQTHTATLMFMCTIRFVNFPIVRIIRAEDMITMHNAFKLQNGTSFIHRKTLSYIPSSDLVS